MFSQIESARRSSTSPARRAFTLVELLVVITIIIILMGLLTPVIMIALGNAKEAAIIAEISTLDSAFKAYKEKHGSYPPSDFTNLGSVGASNTNSPQYIALANHLQSAFPRCNVVTEINTIINSNPNYPNISPAPVSPSQAIYFWLSGFCTDVEHPISGLGPSASREAPLFGFDQTRLTFPKAANGTPITSAAPDYSPSATPGVPYVYFASQSYATHANAVRPNLYPYGNNSSIGWLRPYAADPATGGYPANGIWPAGSAPTAVNPNSFQIISAGLDGNYGGGGTPDSGSTGNPIIAYFSSGNFYGTGDRDNLTNFSPKNLGDSIPK